MFDKENVSPLDERFAQKKTTMHIRKSYDSLESELAKLFFFGKGGGAVG